MKKTVTKEVETVVGDCCGREISDLTNYIPYIQIEDIVSVTERERIGDPYAVITVAGAKKRVPDGYAICRTCLLTSLQKALDSLYDPRTKE